MPWGDHVALWNAGRDEIGSKGFDTSSSECCRTNEHQRSGTSFVVFSKILIASAFLFFHSRNSASSCEPLA